MSEKKYFAAANTVGGFISYYDGIFGKCSRIYIIKGGSGTGKSYFMRQCADHVKRLDPSIEVEYFYCSFDPSSLDGIIIGGDLAIIDGTAPHVYEPTLAGAKENIVDLGQFWDADSLRNRVNDLSKLFSDKKKCFLKAYELLGVCGAIDGIKQSIASEYINKDRICAVASKLVSEIDAKAHSEEKIRISSALGKNGVERFDTYENMSAVTHNIKDEYGLGHLLIGCALEEARRMNVERFVSYDPLHKKRPDAVKIGDTSIILSDDGDDVLNESACGILPSMRDRIASLGDMQASIIAEAVKEFKKASEIHFAIEDIYVNTMDFSKKEEFTEGFLERLKI